MRDSKTFTRSNVIGNNENAINERDGTTVGASAVKRDNNNWQSNVFSGPKSNESTRKRLGKGDKGRDGLFGDSMEKDAYAKKTNLAGIISQKGETRPPVFNESADFERRNKELYGDSSTYEPSKN